MDNFWLFQAVHYGLPALIFLAAGVLWIAFALARRRGLDPATQGCRAAWLTTVTGLVLAGVTVHYWNAIFCFFFFVVGAGVWMSGGEARRRVAAERGNRRYVGPKPPSGPASSFR